MGSSLVKNVLGVRNVVVPAISTTSTTNCNNIMQSRFAGLKLIALQPALLDCFIAFLYDEEQAALGVQNSVSKLNRGKKSPPSSPKSRSQPPKPSSQLRLSFLDTVSDHETLSLANCIVKSCEEMIAYSRSPTVGSALLANIEHPQLIIAICLNLYPEFLKSPHYVDWNRQESAKSKPRSPKHDRLIREVTSSFHSEQYSRIFNKAISSVDTNEMDQLLNFGTWLPHLLLAVENLSISVSIATARPERPGFPLVYVNSAFEVLTGYGRREIVGSNCRILQGEKAEVDVMRRLSNALRDAKPICVTVTNFRKDGMPFRNLLNMKPVFDELGNYCYVFAVQLDVTNAEITPAKLKLVHEVLKILPSVATYRHDITQDQDKHFSQHSTIHELEEMKSL